MTGDPTNGNGDFDDPGPVPGQQGEGEFVAPEGADLGTEAADQEAEATASAFGADLQALKAAIEERLTKNAAEAAQTRALQSVEGDNIVGVGFASADAEALASGAEGLPGEPALALFTVERVAPERLQAEVASVAGTRALSTVPVVQIQTGVVDALSHRFRMRPAPGGISVGNFRITAGTIGCLVSGNSAPRNQRLMVLSNNHVLANSNNAQLGDCICQPGPADGGRCPGDQIAVLERFVPINFAAGSFNFVDCATGWAWPDRVRRELVYLSGGSPVFFRVGAAPVAPSLGMIVGKTGRTTQLRQGRITAINVTVNVNFGGGRVAQFRDQIAVQGFNGDFSAGGDSGSLIWQWAVGLRPVGLLFAGGGGTTFGNRITRVLSALDVRMVV
jgi:hypothetical protein